MRSVVLLLLFSTGTLNASETQGVLEDSRCGPYALGVCLHALGDSGAANQLDEILPHGRGEASLYDLAAAAERLGKKTATVRWRGIVSESEFGTTPAIIPLVYPGGLRHFVAILESRGDQVYMVDFPAPARWRFVHELRDRYLWDGSALHIADTDNALRRIKSQTRSQMGVMLAIAGALTLITSLVLRMRSRRASQVAARTSGFTLIELLVVLAILAVIMAIAAPAVVQGRNVAHRIECAQRLRQLGLALQNYESLHNTYPPSSVQYFDVMPFRFHRQNVSLHARLLPMLEQSAIATHIDYNETGSNSDGEPPSTVHNTGLLSARIIAFECPADNVGRGGCNYRLTVNGYPGWSMAALRTITGRKSRDILDGLSNTVGFSEKLVGDADKKAFTAWRDTAAVASVASTADDLAMACATQVSNNSMHASYSGTSWLFSGFGHTWYNHVLAPNSSTPDCMLGSVLGPLTTGAHTARSWHRGGVNSAKLDGSVQFYSQSIDLVVWRALGSDQGADQSE